MNGITQPTVLVIVGISGHLARSKLLPAIHKIKQAGMLPEQFRVVGITRRDIPLDSVLPEDGDSQDFLRDVVELWQMDLANPEAYKGLNEHLQAIETSFGAPAQRLFYLSVPPGASRQVIRLLGESGTSKVPGTKLLLEKPFGTDLASAESLVTDIHVHFAEEQVYRIDHYLAKEMTQNLVVFRSSNTLFKRTWNKDFIDAVEIVASERIGIEDRAAFYEQTGALRDFVQNHLLQLTALTLMDLPSPGDWQAIPSRRLRALQHLQPPSDVDVQAVRGQYQGYQDEVNNPGSTVETFVSLKLFSNDPCWTGVPITLTTGKALDRKSTEIRLHYKYDDVDEANMLVLRIQPDEGVEICICAKKPGYEREVQRLPLTFSYSSHYDGLPDAYERVLVDAMRSDRTLFPSSEEVLASWKILEPIQRQWGLKGSDGLISYPSGAAPSDVMHAA